MTVASFKLQILCLFEDYSSEKESADPCVSTRRQGNDVGARGGGQWRGRWLWAPQWSRWPKCLWRSERRHGYRQASRPRAQQQQQEGSQCLAGAERLATFRTPIASLLRSAQARQGHPRQVPQKWRWAMSRYFKMLNSGVSQQSRIIWVFIQRSVKPRALLILLYYTLKAEYGLRLASHIFVKDISPESLAARDGNIQEGDVVLKVRHHRLRVLASERDKTQIIG